MMISLLSSSAWENEMIEVIIKGRGITDFYLLGNSHQRRKQFRELQRDSRYKMVRFYKGKARCYLVRVGCE
jgi:hypothetical protein